MNGMKKKLLATTAMLVVSSMMLTTASFAWFTISTAPEITGMTTTVVTNENLEIALAKTTTTTGSDGVTTVDSTLETPDIISSGLGNDVSKTGEYYTYGNLIDLTDDGDAATTTGAGDMYTALVKTLAPVQNECEFTPASDEVTVAAQASTGGDNSDGVGEIQTPDYGYDGRFDGTFTEDSLSATPVAGGFGNMVGTTTFTDGTDTDTSAETVFGYYVDYWMRSNVGGTVTLVEASGTSRVGDSTNIDGADGAGSYFVVTEKQADGTYTVQTTADSNTLTAAQTEYLQSIRIAFVEIGTAETNDAATAVVTAMNDVSVVEGLEAIATYDSSSFKTTFSGSTGVTLTANTDTLIRMYVYLDGTLMNNDATSTISEIFGQLNVQFEIVSGTDTTTTETVDTAMISTVDGVEPTTSGSGDAT